MSHLGSNRAARLFRNLKSALGGGSDANGGTAPGGPPGGPPGESSHESEQRRYGLDRAVNDRHYRTWVGFPEEYDLIAALQVGLLLAAGLKETHRLADVGCGSLRAGRMLIPYLRPERYHAIEPERWLVEEGIDNELGRDILWVKRPRFRFVSDFSLEGFGVEFDFTIAQSVFSHTHPDLLLAGLGKIADSLAPEGLLLATWREGDSKQQGSGWIRKGVRRYTWAQMSEHARESGLSARRLDWPHPRQSWFVACKSGSGAESSVESLSRRLRSPNPGWGEGPQKQGSPGTGGAGAGGSRDAPPRPPDGAYTPSDRRP